MPHNYMPKHTEPCISVEHVGKKYRLGKSEAYVTLRDKISHFISNPFRAFSASAPDEFWAVDDVSFSVAPGEVVGLIGRNGAGKSTLLKIISRITDPTTGKITLRGRVASLLEVGTGFSPELTGRENIYLNGSILGMSRREIDRKLNAIIDFAGVRQFIDTQVKKYSSGMYVRLAFAVAAHLESEILLVDEVLAVGDAEFQKKCLQKISDLASDHKRTVLFVSHSLLAVQKLCTSCILLDRGKIVMKDTPAKVIHEYLHTKEYAQATYEFRVALRNPASITRVSFLNRRKTPTNTLAVGTLNYIEVDFSIHQPLDKATVMVAIHSSDGMLVLSTANDTTGKLQSYAKGNYRCLVTIPAYLLNTGGYLVDVAICYPGISYFDQKKQLAIECVPGRSPKHELLGTSIGGATLSPLLFRVRKVHA